MTRGEIIEDLRNMIGPSPEVDGAGLATWVNDAYMQMVDAISEVNPDYFSALSTADTAEGTPEYDVPDDFERVLMVNIAYDGSTWRRALPLQNINQAGILDNNQGYSVGDPRYYILADQIGFLPVPSAVHNENIKLWYVYTPEELSDDTDEPSIPKKYHHVIKYGAYANYLDQDDQHVAAEKMRQRFDTLVDRMAEAMSINQVDEPKSVLITQGSDLYSDNGYT